MIAFRLELGQMSRRQKVLRAGCFVGRENACHKDATEGVDRRSLKCLLSQAIHKRNGAKDAHFCSNHDNIILRVFLRRSHFILQKSPKRVF